MADNRNWIKTALSHRETDAVPYNVSFSPVSRAKAEKYYGGPVEEVLNFPIRINSPKSIKPLYADPAIYGPEAKDEFLVVWSTNKIDRGSPVKPCLAGANLSGYRFPDPALPYRFEELKDWCEQNRENFTVIVAGDLWERATFMRGMENILLDLALSPAFVRKLLEGITDYLLQTMEILFTGFNFDCVMLSDDYGTQKSLLMSPADWRKYIKPCLAKIYASAKTHGKTVLHHSCGNNYPIIKDMIDIGLDILHPIQPEAMDIFKLKSEFGKYVSLCGGFRTQDLMPFGTPEEIRREVRKLKRIMGKGGGYIFEPGITLQADVPSDNLVALIDEARNREF